MGLVSHADARAYADWLVRVSRTRWRLPTEQEWEKAARGTKGMRFPWGDEFDPSRVNSADRGRRIITVGIGHSVYRR